MQKILIKSLTFHHINIKSYLLKDVDRIIRLVFSRIIMVGHQKAMYTPIQRSKISIVLDNIHFKKIYLNVHTCRVYVPMNVHVTVS